MVTHWLNIYKFNIPLFLWQLHFYNYHTFTLPSPHSLPHPFIHYLVLLFFFSSSCSFLPLLFSTLSSPSHSLFSTPTLILYPILHSIFPFFTLSPHFFTLSSCLSTIITSSTSRACLERCTKCDQTKQRLVKSNPTRSANSTGEIIFICSY